MIIQDKRRKGKTIKLASSEGLLSRPLFENLKLRFSFPDIFRITRPHNRFDISAHVKIAFDFDAQRIASRNEIFQNLIDNVFVKNFYFAETVDIKISNLLSSIQRSFGTYFNLIVAKSGKSENGQIAVNSGISEINPNLASGVFIF